ncbi:MAG: condensation domain-containing protein, partial [Bacteroidota bacterium]
MATELELSASQKLICEQGPLYPRRFLCIKVFSSLSKERLNESFSQIVNRHENLRLRISNDDFSKYPRCEIQDEAYLDIQFFDWTDMSLEKLQKRIDGLKTFDVKASGLVQQTPLSLTVIETAFKWFYLYLNTSALTTDLLSCLNIVNEFEHFYIQNTNPTADIYQFSQYAIWHNNILYEQDEEAKAFWSQRRLYSSHEEALTLEKKCQNVSEMRLPSILTLDLGGEVLSKIKEYIELNDISLKLFLVSCWSILLKKYSKNNVVTVGLINEERSYDVFD